MLACHKSALSSADLLFLKNAVSGVGVVKDGIGYPNSLTFKMSPKCLSKKIQVSFHRPRTIIELNCLAHIQNSLSDRYQNRTVFRNIHLCFLSKLNRVSLDPAEKIPVMLDEPPWDDGQPLLITNSNTKEKIYNIPVTVIQNHTR